MSGVGPDVLFEVVLPPESLVTQRTRIWSGTAVDPSVSGEFLVACEPLVASFVVTLVGPLSCVDSQVALQLALIAEGRPTLATAEPLGAWPPRTHSFHLRGWHQHV